MKTSKDDPFQKLKKAVADSYSEWVIQTWIQTGGLVSPGMAARMLNVSMTRINQIWNDRKFEKFSHPYAKNKTLLKFTDLIQILEERKKSKMTVENQRFKLSIETTTDEADNNFDADKLKAMLNIVDETKAHILQLIENQKD